MINVNASSKWFSKVVPTMKREDEILAGKRASGPATAKSSTIGDDSLFANLKQNLIYGLSLAISELDRVAHRNGSCTLASTTWFLVGKYTSAVPGDV